MPIDQPIRALEWFAGLGGFATAVDERIKIAAAIDISQPAQLAYQNNYQSRFWVRTIESLLAAEVDAVQAEFWWLSPPCQPFTKQGRQRDWEDPRTAALRRIIELIARLKPTYIGLENVLPFRASIAHQVLVETLRKFDYSFCEWELCPSQFGLPNRRVRYYLGARLHGHTNREPSTTLADRQSNASKPIREFVSAKLNEESSWLVPVKWLREYGEKLHIIDLEDSRAIARCFTAAYGRSPLRSGSYIATDRGPRFFRPDEILRLLGFSQQYELPDTLTRLQAWHLVGNSLAIPPVQYVVDCLLET